MMRSGYWRLVVAIALAAPIGACTSPIGIACTEQPVPSFVVTVVDATSLDPIGAGSTLSWTGAATGTSSIAATDTAHNGDALSGAYEVAGSFQLRVTHAGYADWTRAVRISRDQCHVITGNVTAQMQRVAATLSATAE